MTSVELKARVGEEPNTGYYLLTTLHQKNGAFFLKTKDEQYDVLIDFFKNLKKMGTMTKKVNFLVRTKVRMDNSGENKKFAEMLKENDMEIDVEFTPVDSPQFNGIFERCFATLYGRVRAMLNGGGFFNQNRQLNWAECANTVNKLDDLLCYKRGIPANFFTTDVEKYKNNLHPFGELAVVTIGGKKKLKAKLENRGETYYFVGYPDNHAGDVFRIVNLKTNRVTETQDVQFLGKMYGEVYDQDNFLAYIKGRNKAFDDVEVPLDSKIEEIEQNDNQNDSLSTLNAKEEFEEMKKYISTKTKKISRLERELKRLETFYNPTSGFNADESGEDNNVDDETAYFGRDNQKNGFYSAVESGYLEPKKIQEAWHHPNKQERLNWRQSIQKEIRDMIRRDVWRHKKGRRYRPDVLLLDPSGFSRLKITGLIGQDWQH